jgi:hypothetical protein
MKTYTIPPSNTVWTYVRITTLLRDKKWRDYHVLSSPEHGELLVENLELFEEVK